MSTGGARISRIDLCVDQPVKCHRGRTCKDHAQQNADQILPSEHSVWLKPGDGCGQQRKGKCEDRMAEPNQFKELANSFSEATRI